MSAVSMVVFFTAKCLRIVYMSITQYIAFGITGANYRSNTHAVGYGYGCNRIQKLAMIWSKLHRSNIHAIGDVYGCSRKHKLAMIWSKFEITQEQHSCHR